MKAYRQPLILTIVILFCLILVLIGCRLFRVSQPPLPTIVSIEDTAVSDPISEATSAPSTMLSATDEVVTDPSAMLFATDEVVTDPSAMLSATNTATDEVVIDPPILASTVEPIATVKTVELEEINLKLIPTASGFEKPVFLTHAGDDSGRLFVVEQAGRILIVKGGVVKATPFLDISDIVGSNASEQGLLSLAFHPDYVNNGYFFVNYTNKQGNTVIARYSRSNNPDIADSDSPKILLTMEQPYSNHNGGQIAFGPAGYLYIGMGDGGAAADPQNNAQNLDTVLGKLLRIDVDQGDPYGVPANNPFVGQDGVRPEIWSYGWRNPWRFSFDISSNDMYIADVGQNQYEEVHVEWVGTSGQNYGWRLMEGFHCFKPANCDPSSLDVVLPIAEYEHTFGCSITGGYVYRGSQFPMLDGIYFYGDFCSGIIRGLRYEADGSWSEAELLQSELSISSFGQDEAGEVYVIDHNGDVYLMSY